MRRGLNTRLGGGGLHHVAVEARDLEASLRFYVDGLGFVERLRFPEDELTVVMLDTGDGTYLELFSPTEKGPHATGGPVPTGPALFHFAVRVGDVDDATRRAVEAGGRLVEEPTDMTLDGDPPTPCRYSFVEGPSGESIELIRVDGL